MNATHEALMILTAHMPMRTIEVNGQPYLERYYVNSDVHGMQTWLHRFLRNDSEPHLHSHPWDAESFIICGWYTEQTPERMYLNQPSNINFIPRSKMHRIIEVEPHTWTIMRVQPGRDPEWYFYEQDGTRVAVQSSPEAWHRECKTRGEQ
jgi:hypothetical protein